MHVGLVGVGRMGAVHAEVLAELAEVSQITMCDADSGRAVQLARTYGADHAVDVDALISLRPDALVIAAPTPLHAELIVRGAEVGAAVLCEKPIALDIETTNEVVTRVSHLGAFVQIGFNRRFDAGFQAARQHVTSGALGRLHLVRMGTHDPAPPPVEYLALSGGLFRDMHVHDFDALRFVTGAEVESVYADGSVLVDEAIGELGDVDTAAVVMRLVDGALAVLTGCRQDPLGYDVRVELFGALDSVTVGIEPRAPLRSIDREGLLRGDDGWKFFVDRFASAYRAQLKAFVQCVAAGAAPDDSACSPHDAREALLLAMAAERSLREGRAVRVDEVRAEAVPA